MFKYQSVKYTTKRFRFFIGSVALDHKYIAGQRIVRHLIRRDFDCQYRTGRFHCCRYILKIQAQRY